MHGQFMVTRGGRDVFLTEEELRVQARRGLLSRSDRVFHPQLGRWLYARDVAEVEEALRQAELLGRPSVPESVVLVPVNGRAVAGFVLGTMGYIPFVGLVLAGLGLFLSARALAAAQERYGSGHRLAVAGLLLSLLCLLPQLFLTGLLLGG